MPTLDKDQPLFAKCLPRVVVDIERTANLTQANLAQVTPDQFESIYMSGGKYRVDHSIVEADFIGKSCIPKQNGFYDLMKAFEKQLDPTRMGSRTTRSGTIEFEPFIKMGRRDPIQDKYWQATLVGTPATVDSVVQYTYDLFSKAGIPSVASLFPAETRVHISAVNTSDGTKTFAQMKVVSSSLSSGHIRLVLRLWQAGSVAPVGSLKVPGDLNITTTGVLIKGTPNISDYEKYCAVRPPLNSYRESLFWVESIRKAMVDSDLLKDYLKHVIADNPYYKKYFHVDDVEYNRQVQEAWEADQVNQFFFGKASDANQTATDWPNLPTISLAADSFGFPWSGGTTVVGRKADTVGVLEQLYECDRVTDHAGQALVLSTLFERLYEIRRIRRDLGQKTDMIEVIMNSQFALNFQTAMLRYFNSRSEGLLRVNLALQEKGGAEGPFGFYFTDYKLDFPQGLTLRVMTNEAMDDWTDAHRFAYSSGTKNLANNASMYWIIDWANVYRAVLGSNSVTNKTGTLDQLAAVNGDMACRMKVPQVSYRLDSALVATIAECSKSSLVGVNFDPCAVPDSTTGVCGTAFMPQFDPSA